MGIFAGCYGEIRIPEDRKAELKERMLTLFTRGGMMDVDVLNIQGHCIELLRPPAYDEEDCVAAQFNYFEDDWWEDAGYDAVRGEMWSGKVGFSVFSRVVRAAYVLQEFYSDSFCIAQYDGDIRDEVCAIGWLNHLFGEHYTNKRVTNLWDIYKVLP